MKTIILTLILSVAGLLAAPARAASPVAPVAPSAFDARVDELQRLNLQQRDDLVAAQLELRNARASAVEAIDENVKQNSAFTAQKAGLEKTIRKQSRVLDKWYVRFVVWLAGLVFWISLGVGGLYAVAFVGGFLKPTTFVFKVAQWLIRALPGGNFVDNWHPTTVVRMQEVPVVEVPARPAAPRPAKPRTVEVPISNFSLGGQPFGVDGGTHR